MSAASPRTAAFVAPLQPALLRQRLDFLSAEHARQTVLIAHLERLAREPRARPARRLAELLLRWLTEELPVHFADEERSLYPRLRAHDSAGVLRRLAAEHGRDRMLVQDVTAGLRHLAQGEPAPEGFAVAALAFTALHRRHLQLEEAEVTPLARRCLTAEMLGEVAAEMAERRAG